MSEPRTLSIDLAFSAALVVRCLGEESEDVVVAGRYELLRRIGRGGQGTVYEAHDRELGRRVALKVMPLGDRAEAQREAMALAKLDHPNVVTVHEHGEQGDSRYLALQLLEGPTLREWCLCKSPEAIVAKYIEAGRGLEAAHAAGLVHRDFKPSNVRIGPQGQAVVVDFGLARNLRTLERDSSERNVVAGTLAYTAPERLLGSVGDERADQFSFCVALWEALSGENPYGPCLTRSAGDRYESIRAGLRGEPQGAKHVERALHRGLAVQPGDRYRTVGDLVGELSAAPQRRWGASEIAGAGLILIVLAIVLAAMLPDAPGPRGWVTESLVRIDAAQAVASARAGNDQGALLALETAQRQGGLRPGEAKILALAGIEAASEFEKLGQSESAVYGWSVAIMLARASGDTELAREATERFHAFVDRERGL